MKPLKLEFNEKPRPLSTRGKGSPLIGNVLQQWHKLKAGFGCGVIGGYNTQKKIHKDGPTFTLCASGRHWHHSAPRFLSDLEVKELSSFPDDYESSVDINYLCGMSVPPFMTQRISSNIQKQVFDIENENPLRTGQWNLTDLATVKKNGLKVFSCFCCGGGSSMGYKLAGYDVLGGVEIDKDIAEVYEKNLKPKYLYKMSIQDFNKIENSKLPAELFELDILDGSPPCSTFSMAGSREKKWGKKAYFREGQEEQVLDDLFFHFIETARKLKPKVVVAENVKGLLQGNAKYYVKQIVNGFKDAGYGVQIFLLNAATMGVPQRRERVFFICQREF